MRLKVQNWPAYEAGLRRRGSLTLWIEDEALDCRQSCGPNGQARYADAAIQISLLVRTAFKLPLRFCQPSCQWRFSDSFVAR
jgi:hypothetical protein